MDQSVPMSFLFVLMPLCFVLGILATVTSTGRKILAKIKLFVEGWMYMLFCRDKHWPKQQDPDSIKDCSKEDYIDLVFVRHGESVWNEVFNKGINIGMIFRFFNALVTELKMLAMNDSVFLDSPLGKDGLDQATHLLQFITNETVPMDNSPRAKHLLGLISAQPQAKEAGGDSSTQHVIFVVSNLRRAIQTLLVGFWSRFSKTNEQMLVLSSLQEISFNVDCMPLAGPNQVPVMGTALDAIGARKSKVDISALFDAAHNQGNRPLTSNGLLRMHSFLLWAFSKSPRGCFVVGGHSLYFRSFFRTFLPFSSNHEAKKRKIKNCGVVGLRVFRGQQGGRVAYRIDPESVVVLYGGFA